MSNAANNNVGMSNLGYASFNPDRLGTAFSFAVAIHAALILGITFTHEQRSAKAPQLEVTLAQFKQEKNRGKADYVADHDQQASGAALEKSLLSAPEIAEFQDTQVRDVNHAYAEQSAASQAEKLHNPVYTTLAADRRVLQSDAQPQEQADSSAENESTEKRASDIASLAARLSDVKQDAAKRPRVRRITSVSTKKAMDARYLLKWERKIELLGNQNYPREALAQKLYGDLRLLVVLAPNGAVDRVEILQSSGHDVLDHAAISIVKLAAPYEPFSAEMQQEIDKLEIVRTWQFRKNRVRASRS